jgi:hypothetical protein
MLARFVRPGAAHLLQMYRTRARASTGNSIRKDGT